MKGIKVRISIVCLLLFSMVVCLGNPIVAKADKARAAVTAVQFTQSKVTINKGASKTLTANILPSSSNYLTVTFLSNSSNVELKRKSNNQVTVTGKRAGTATITAVAKATGSNVEVKSTCVVTVVDPSSSKITIPSSATVYVGSSKSLKDSTTVSPSGAKITWKSSDTSVATVNTNGRVYGHKEGEATITATVAGSVSDTCKVTVKKKKIDIGLSNTTVYVGSSKSLKDFTTTTPKGTAITWTSSDTSVATVNTNGRVYGQKEGTVTITATVSGNVKDTCKVTVKKKEIDISLTNTTAYVGSSKSLKDFTTTTPKGTAITWTSSDTSVATVNQNGRVYGQKEGTVTITATVSGNVKDTCKVTIKEKSISLSSSSIEVAGGKSVTLKASVIPTSSNIIWESSNSNIAMVDQNGRVTGVGNGEATITATISGTDKSASCKVSVVGEVKASISISPKKKTLHIDSEGGVDSYQLEATVMNASDATVVWSIANSNIASISQDGTVTAKAKGTTTVTAALKEDATVTAKTTIVVGNYELSNTEFANRFYHTWQGTVDGVVITNRVTQYVMFINEGASTKPEWNYEVIKKEKMADKSIWIYASMWSSGGERRYGLSKISPDGKTMKVTYSQDGGVTYTGRTEEFKRID